MSESKVNRMIGKRRLITVVMLVALICMSVFGVLNLDTVRLSAYESPAIYINPAYVNAVEAIGTNYTFSVLTDSTAPNKTWGFEFDITYNPNVLECREILNGGLIDETVMWYGEFNNTEGTMHVGNNFQTDPPPADPPYTTGPGTLANITFTVVGSGTSNITFVERKTRLIGVRQEGETWDYYNIVDDTPIGHIEGSRLDSSIPGIPGDINSDSTVNILDAILLAGAFGSRPGDGNWNPNADINNDDVVNILDAIILAGHFGESA